VPIYRHLHHQLTDQVQRAATHAFSRSFLVAAVIALAALIPIAMIRQEAPL
jgi:hypothetical protein